MQPLKIVVIGGVAGGASAAAKARRTNENAEITMFEKGPYVSFANCGLPYYVGETIRDRADLLLQTPERFWKRYRVRVMVRHEVLAIDRSTKTVTARNLETGTESLHPYDRLILAPGAGAIVPPLPGIDSANVFTVKTVPDSDAIRTFLAHQSPSRALIVGAGFIGLETAEALKRRGLAVTIVELVDQVLPAFDSDIAALVAMHLKEQGLELVLGDGIRAFHTSNGMAREAELTSGRRVPCDLVILSIGVRPELKLAQEAGLEIGKAGGIVVDDRQRTSDPDIFAAGDAVETLHLVAGTRMRIPLAGPANKQGRVAGANAAGGDLRFLGAVGTAIVESMGITAAKTGLSMREAREHGFDAFESVIHPLDHAEYYPGARPLHLKLVVEQGSGRLLGAQVLGEEGVDKRIDVLATALAGRMTVHDLEQLDLAYAPQFSSAKDAVILAGFVAANAVRGDVQTITCQEVLDKMASGHPFQLLDVRTPQEYDDRHLPGARLIPIDDLREHLHELDPQQETVVYCKSGLRGYLAARILLQHGFSKVWNLTGGITICPGDSESRT